MGAILLYCGYIKCNDGSFHCETKFPDISHVMGRAPLNKLYAIMLTVYACVKQAYVRAYYERLKGLVSENTNRNLVIYGAISCVFGPMIGYFDVYYWMTVHCSVTALFVIGEVLYVLTMISILNRTRLTWQKSAQSSIDNLVISKWVFLVLGVYKMGTKILGIQIGSYGAYIEWIVFFISFYMFAIMSNIMPCDNVVVPVEDEKEEN